MMMKRKTYIPLLGLALITLTAATPSKTSRIFAARIADACIGKWEDQPCLKAVSESTLVLAANYGSAVQGESRNQIKEHCAAATAATEETIPAYAMKSAYTECANTISDVYEATGVSPDQSHYQLLVGPVLCMSKDRRCATIEDGLKKYQ